MVWLLVKIIKIYQMIVSPFIRTQCRFIPTCSQYAIVALQTHGVLKGGWMTIMRLLKCQPFYNDTPKKIYEYEGVSSSSESKTSFNKDQKITIIN